MNREKSNEFERALNALLKCNKVIRENHDEQLLLRNLCKVIVKDVGYRLAWVGYKEADEQMSVSPVISYGFDEGYIEMAAIVWSETERGLGPTGTAVCTGKPVICQNMTTDDRFKPWRQEAIKRGYAASIALPIIIDDSVIGALSIYAAEPDAFNGDEVELLQELTETLAFGISHIRQNKILNESEERYRIIFNEAIMPVLTVNLETLEFKDVNEAACRFYGYSKEEFLSKRLPDIHTLSEANIKAIASEVIGKKRNLITTRHRTSYGTLKDVEVYTGPVTIQGKQYLCASIHDITERIRLEQEKQAINLALQQKVEHEIAKNDNMINGYAYCEMIFDNDGRPVDFVYLEVNKAFERLTGLKKEDVIDRRVSEIFPAINEQHRELMEIYGRVARGSGVANYELLFKPLDKWLNINVYCPKKGCFIAIFEDFTRRKDMETALRDSEEKYRLIFQHENDAIYLCDAETLELMDFNDAFSALYGYTKDEMIGKSIIVLCAEPELARKTIDEALESGGLKVTDRLHRHKDGTLFTAEISVGVFAYKRRKVLSIISRDITQRVRLEEELRQMTVNLEKKVAEEVAKNREKDRLVYEQARHVSMGELLLNISHHWRQPLCAVAVTVQDIKDAYLHNELDVTYMNENIEHAMSELKALSDTIDNFRNFYVKTEKEEVFNIADAIKKAESVISGYIEDNNILLDKELDDTLTAAGYANEFAHVILNILTNAKDTFERIDPTGGIIKIRLYRDVSKKIITIANNGGEIPTDIIDKVFDPYFTTKDRARLSGMGLYMAKVIIEKNMNGMISVRNADGWCEVRIEI